MQRFIRSRTSSVIGLDIRMNEVRLIQLRHEKQTYWLEHIEIIALPPRAIMDAKIQMIDQVAACLHAEVKRLQLEGMPAVVALPIQSVITKRIQVTKNSINEPKQNEFTENISRHFPGVTQELCYDYAVLPATDILQDQALLVATRSEQLNNYVNAVERSGLLVKIVDVDIYALARAAKFTQPAISLMSMVAILEVSVSSVQCVVLHKDEVIYHLQFDYVDVNEISTKINSAIQLCCSTHHVKQMDAIYFSGDDQVVVSIIKTMKTTSNVPMQTLNPFQTMLMSSTLSFEKVQAVSPRMMVCCGLAMRRMPEW